MTSTSAFGSARKGAEPGVQADGFGARDNLSLALSPPLNLAFGGRGRTDDRTGTTPD
jgi:hypothetical protein